MFSYYFRLMMGGSWSWSGKPKKLRFRNTGIVIPICFFLPLSFLSKSMREKSTKFLSIVMLGQAQFLILLYNYRIYYRYLRTVSWIRIRSDQHHFAIGIQGLPIQIRIASGFSYSGFKKCFKSFCMAGTWTSCLGVTRRIIWRNMASAKNVSYHFHCKYFPILS